MGLKKLSDLNLDECKSSFPYIIETSHNRMSMKTIFDWIKETAINEGLTVKMEGENIMFIHGTGLENTVISCQECGVGTECNRKCKS